MWNLYCIRNALGTVVDVVGEATMDICSTRKMAADQEDVDCKADNGGARVKHSQKTP